MPRNIFLFVLLSLLCSSLLQAAPPGALGRSLAGPAPEPIVLSGAAHNHVMSYARKWKTTPTVAAVKLVFLGIEAAFAEEVRAAREGLKKAHGEAVQAEVNLAREAMAKRRRALAKAKRAKKKKKKVSAEASTKKKKKKKKKK